VHKEYKIIVGIPTQVEAEVNEIASQKFHLTAIALNETQLVVVMERYAPEKTYPTSIHNGDFVTDT
jgi:hypothetical protein